MEWAEAEIEQAQRRHPVQAALLWTTFRLMVPTQDLMPDASAASLHPFVLSNVKPGATLLTDSWKGYLGLGGRGYAHKQVNIKRSGRTSGELLPGVHTVASHLDRWWLGTTTGRSAKGTSTPTSTSSPFASTGATAGHAACCSTA
jgi:ISXO2 transposase-like protein